MNRPRSLSLRNRVMVGFGLIAAIAVAVAVAVTLTTQAYLVAQLDERLRGLAGGPVATMQPDVGAPTSPAPGGITRPSEAYRGFATGNGEVTWVFEPTGADATGAKPAFTTAELTPGTVQWLTVPASDGGPRFRLWARPVGDGWDLTALSMADVEAATSRLVAIQSIGIAATLAALAVVAWWVVRLGITPMRRMVAASTQIAEGDTNVRLTGAAPGTETADLADALNTMVARLASSLAERERSEARLREFVADASHELRTPLTTVLGYAELFRRGALTREADITDAWVRTEAEASRMRRLVDDMLELAKYDAEPQLRLEAVDLSALAEELATDAAVAWRHLTVACEAAPVTITADGDKLRQALLNVIGNAALHGGGVVTIAVTAASEGARIRVSDDGPGMPEDIAARATERFVRGDSSRQRATGGAGLGLAITAAIVHAHGGTIDVGSGPDGTTITVTLPEAGTSTPTDGDAAHTGP